MKALFKFSTIALLLIVLIGLVLFFAIGHSVYSGKGASVKFVNSSGQHIESAYISVAGQSCSVKQLGVGGEIECHFENLHDSSYSVSVTLQGGTVYSEPSLGYVTGGMNFNDTITINQSGAIELVSSPST
ncbi:MULTISPECIES: hypothetical protein [unclassified Endozoicomonas]|uniref:hypothetical protein n=1 Tax=unclassified Endozoicomonas TaxID=2644528 RepID=UPI003BB4E7B8